MPRDLPIGNGSLLVNVDHTGQIRDIYWPHVGQENHTSGRVCRLGVWVDNQFSWLDDAGWQRRLCYNVDSLVTNSVLKNKELKLHLLLWDCVDFHENLLVRQVTVENLDNREREIRLFFCHDLSISGTTVGDSAYYEPETGSLFHYKGKRWFMISLFRGWPGNWQHGLDQWAIGIKGINGLEGSWRDAEDGILSGNPVAQGRIDSVVALHLQAAPKAQASGWLTLAAGVDFAAVTQIQKAITRKGPITFMERTAAYWKLWANKEDETFALLPTHLVTLYRRSLLILRTQIDNQGAIIAANDHDIAQFNRDTYSYMWPRDGALVASTLIDAGYSELSRNFFDFCHRTITEQGFLLHKYTPDGSLASSWHAWYHGGETRLPIQQDETSLVLWALWQHFRRSRDIEFVKRHYRGLVIRAAEWICSYVDEDTGLPLPSWDLWEERYGVHSWTVAATWAGLQAAANFAEAFGENKLSLRYQRVAAAMQTGAKTHLYHTGKKRFVRSLLTNDKGSSQDLIMDASLIGLWFFNMFAADDPMIVQTMEAMRSKLWVRSAVGGMARYENDYYHQVSQDTKKIPGNPWFICTLWLAGWYIATAKEEKELQPAMELIEWIADHTLASGVMAEQVHPYTNEPLSVSPLTWSHATYVATLFQYNKKLEELSTHDN
jgi:GH15 family glucan-1,4-alpha-glucosidase